MKLQINQILINSELEKKGYNGQFIDCNSILCIANNDVEIQNNSKQIISRASNIITEIKSFNTNIILSEEIQEEIYNILIKNSLPTKTYKVEGRAERVESSLIELKKLLKVNEKVNSTIIEFLKAMNNNVEPRIYYLN